MTDIPFSRVIWNAQDCADYLKISRTHFLNCVRHAQGFPEPIDMPPYYVAGKEKRMDPRWSAEAVTTWALGISQDSRKVATTT